MSLRLFPSDCIGWVFVIVRKLNQNDCVLKRHCIKRPCKTCANAQKHTLFFHLWPWLWASTFNFPLNCHLKKTSAYSMTDNPIYKIVYVVNFGNEKNSRISNIFVSFFCVNKLGRSTFRVNKNHTPGIEFNGNFFFIFTDTM